MKTIIKKVNFRYFFRGSLYLLVISFLLAAIILYRGLGTSPRLMASAGICKSFLESSFSNGL